MTGVRSDILSCFSHPVARSGWVQGQTQWFPQSSFLKRFIITLKKVIVSNECLKEQRILLCLLVSVYVCACECSCVYRTSIAISLGRVACTRLWERKKIEKETQYSFNQPSKVSCVYLGASCCSEQLFLALFPFGVHNNRVRVHVSHVEKHTRLRAERSLLIGKSFNKSM